VAKLVINLTERIGIVGEFAYGYATHSYGYKDNYGYSFSKKTTYSSVPINASLLFITPVGKRFSTYIGLGIGYYLIKVKEDWIGKSTLYGTKSDTETDRMNGFAPHINVGIETAVSMRIVIFGEVKQIVGKTKFKETDEDGYSERDVHFKGPEVKIDIRFYFKD
jgi:opacity protein-like surface antigen